MLVLLMAAAAQNVGASNTKPTAPTETTESTDPASMRMQTVDADPLFGSREADINCQVIAHHIYWYHNRGDRPIWEVLPEYMPRLVVLLRLFYGPMMWDGAITNLDDNPNYVPSGTPVFSDGEYLPWWTGAAWGQNGTMGELCREYAGGTRQCETVAGVVFCEIVGGLDHCQYMVEYIWNYRRDSYESREQVENNVYGYNPDPRHDTDHADPDYVDWEACPDISYGDNRAFGLVAA